MRAIFIVGSILFLVLLGVWINFLRGENDKLKAKLQKVEAMYNHNIDLYKALYDDDQQLRNLLSRSSESLGQWQAQLKVEKQKLENLKKTLATEKTSLGKAAEGDDADDHIESDESDIQAVQARLNRLGDDNHSVDQKSREYLNQQAYQREAQKADLSNRIQTLDASIDQVKAQISVLPRGRANPNWQNDLTQLNSQIADLKNQRGTLAAQRRDLDVQAKATSNQVATEVTKEKDEVAGDRYRWQKRLSELKDDLKKWKKIKSDHGKAKSETPPRIVELKKDIAAENDKIAGLEKIIRDLQAH